MQYSSKYVVTSTTQRQSGFTLIEVMVGVAIFAVLSALIVSSLRNNGDRNAKLEAQRFIAVMNEVRDEAVISGKTLILQMDEKSSSYDFSVLGASDSAGSSSLADSLLRRRSLHSSVKLKWEVFENVSGDDEDGDFDDEQASADITPRVFVSALGELTPFQARFGGDEHDFVVQLNDEGVLTFDIKSSNFF